MANFEDGGRATIERFGEILKDDCKGQTPYKNRSLGIRSWGYGRTYDLSDGSEVTVVRRERERTWLGRKFMGPLTIRNLLVVDIQGPFDELGGLPYCQFFLTEAYPEPVARTGFRDFGDGISSDGFTDLIGYPGQAAVGTPTEGQLNMLEGALHELVNR